MVVPEIGTTNSVKIVCISDSVVYVDVKGRCVFLLVCMLRCGRSSSHIIEVINETTVHVEKLFIYSSVIYGLLVLNCRLILLHVIQGILWYLSWSEAANVSFALYKELDIAVIDVRALGHCAEILRVFGKDIFWPMWTFTDWLSSLKVRQIGRRDLVERHLR